MDKQLKPKDPENSIPEMELDEEIRNVRKNIGKGKQVLATIIANISTLAVPMITVPAYLWRDHHSTDSVVLPCIVAILGLFLSYHLCECCGRKTTLRLSAIPLIVCCSLVFFSDRYGSYMNPFLFGIFGGSMCLYTVPIYVSEISCDSMRGTLGSMRMIFMTIGIALVFFKLGEVLPMVFPLIFIVAMQWMPESPVDLVRDSRIGDATRSEIVPEDYDVKSTDNKRLKTEQSVQRIPELESCFSVGVRTIKSYFSDPADSRGFMIALGLLIIQSLWEVDRLVWWNEATVRYHPMNTFILMVIPILSSVLATILINFVGRRSLLLISCAGLLIHSEIRVIITFDMIERYLAMLSDESLMYMNVYVLPILYLSSYYIGLGTVTSVIAVEVFQQKVVALGYMICLSASWIVMSIGVWIQISHISLSFGNILVDRLIRAVLYICIYRFAYFHVPKTQLRAI